MSKLAAAIVTVLLAGPTLAQQPPTIDWNSTVADIRADERHAPLETSEKRVTYEAQLKGESYHLEYLFGDGGHLVNVLYYKSFPSEGLACLVEYQRVRTAYAEELGEAESETVGDENRLTQYSQDNLCKAAADGVLAADTQWHKNSNTRLKVLLSVWKGAPYVGISATPRSEQIGGL
jgi:hypothetical protein